MRLGSQSCEVIKHDGHRLVLCGVSDSSMLSDFVATAFFSKYTPEGGVVFPRVQDLLNADAQKRRNTELSLRCELRVKCAILNPEAKSGMLVQRSHCLLLFTLAPECDIGWLLHKIQLFSHCTAVSIDAKGRVHRSQTFV